MKGQTLHLLIHQSTGNRQLQQQYPSTFMEVCTLERIEQHIIDRKEDMKKKNPLTFKRYIEASVNKHNCLPHANNLVDVLKIGKEISYPVIYNFLYNYNKGWDGEQKVLVSGNLGIILSPFFTFLYSNFLR